MHTWRRQTFIVALCLVAVMAARFYVNRTLGQPPVEPVEESLSNPQGDFLEQADRGTAPGAPIVTVEAVP
jgi:hypothetical protein